MAQTVTWSAPASGFIFDAVGGVIRPISGFVGSAVAGSPVMSGIQWAAVAPNQNSALVCRDSTLLWIPNLSLPGQSQTLGSVTDAKQALWAVDSSRAVVLTNDEVVWLAFSNSVPSVEGTWRLTLRSTGVSRGRPSNAIWSLLAADRPAGTVLLTSRTGSGSQAWIASTTIPPIAIPFPGLAVAAAFAATSPAVFIADAASNQIVRVDDPTRLATITPIVTSPAYFGDPAGIVLSPDDTHVFGIDREALVIREFDATTGALLKTLEADAVTRYLRLFTTGLFVLDPAASGQPFLFLGTTEPAQVTFVPRPQ
ncbi:MAG: hypothetical protein ABSB15_24320 [Bryobacteraceae bacterium]|jgi:hypothetical protein